MRILAHPAAPVREWPVPRTDNWNHELDDALVVVPGVENTVAQLHQGNALVVTTGQQPGLFTGPLYTFHKALAAAALAKRLSREWSRPVVPVFWLAGDDHDFAEASEAAWTDATGKLTHFALTPRAVDAPQRSMSHERFSQEIEAGLNLLEQSFPIGVARDETMAWLRRHYREGNTIHGAFRGALAEQLAPYGIVCIDPTHQSFKRAQSKLILKALEHAGRLDGVLAALPEAGTGIAAGDGASLVFYEDEHGRDRLVIDGDGFRTRRSGHHFTLELIRKEVEEHPERFSANVLLRPVIESALLPTVAYVGGPGEMKYLTGQAFALYPELGVTRQLPVARWGGTLIHPWGDRVLQRLGVTAEELFADDGRIGRELIGRDTPDAVKRSLDALREQIDATTRVLDNEGSAVDAGLVRSIQAKSQHLIDRTNDLQHRFERHLKRREDIAWSQYRRIADAVRPTGKPQERVLSAPTFLGQYGGEWLDAVTEATVRWADTLKVTPA